MPLQERFPDFEPISDKVDRGDYDIHLSGETVEIATGAKALRCLEIAQRIFPHESDRGLESVAVELMYLTDNGIDRILRLLRISNPSNPSFSSISLTKEPVPGTGVVEVMKEVKRENRYSILRRENNV
jgi:hypothetical protein